MRVNFLTNACGSRFEKISDNEWVIQGVPMMVDDTVMNGIFYPKEENQKGLQSYRKVMISLRHPEDENGNPVSAMTGDGMYKHYSGGVVTNTYNHNGVNYFDAKFKINMMKAQDGGEWYVRQMEEGLPIGISTGLFFDGNNESGRAPDGRDYYAVARNQVGDHIAMLPENEPPAGGYETFMRFNGDEEETITVNVDEFLASIEVDEPIESAFDKFKEWCKQTFAPLKTNSDNSQEINNTDEGDAMRETLIAALEAKGITVNADITDAELLVKYDEANKPDVAAAVNAAIKPLTDEIATMKTQITANADKELDSLAELAANSLKGFDKETLKAMGTDKIHKALSDNGVVVGAPSAVNHESPKDKATGLNSKMPWEE